MISASSAVSNPTSATGNGLDGRYTDIAGVTSGADVTAGVLAADTAPTATFTATMIDYPNGAANNVRDTTTLATFLGSDASSLSSAGDTTLTGSMFVFEGFINIPDA